MNGKRVAIVDSTTVPYPTVVTTIQGLGATTVVKAVGTPSPKPASIVLRELERDLDAYLLGLEIPKGQGRAGAQASIDALLSNGTPTDPTDDFEVIVVPSGNALVGIADGAGYPVLTVRRLRHGQRRPEPDRRHVRRRGVRRGDAPRRGLRLRAGNERPARPSFTNPSMWRCSPHHCYAGDLLAME